METCGRITEVSHDYPGGIDSQSLREIRARKIDRRKRAVAGPQEAVLHEAWVKIGSRNICGWVDAGRWTAEDVDRPKYVGTWWRIERRDVSVETAQETM